MKKLPFFLLMLVSTISMATHFKAADIQAKVTNCEKLEYQIIISTYEIPSYFSFTGGEIDFGDGNFAQMGFSDFIRQRDLSNEYIKYIYQTTHQFQQPGNYLISFRWFNREANLKNMDRSVDTPLYAETEIKVLPRYGCNSSPAFNFDPVYFAKPGQTFTHNAAAIDPDMDSLSYEVTVSKQRRDLEVLNYLFPNDPKFAGTTEAGNSPAIYEINNDGTLQWNAPGEIGEYTLTFRVNEWRKIGSHTLYMGSATRDMQVIVDNIGNDRPQLSVPKDTTIVSGNTLQATLQAEDENPVTYQAASAALQWRWNTIDTATLEDKSFKFTWNLKDVPFQTTRVPVYFQVSDRPQEDYQMATFAAWNVTIVNQYNQNLALEFTENNQVDLNWEPLDETTGYEIWRKVKLPHEFFIINSEAPMDNQGMDKIADIAAGTSNFQDPMESVDFFNRDVCYQITANTAAGDTIIAQKCISQDPDGLVLSIEHEEDLAQLQVYPNPFTDAIIIHGLPAGIERVQLTSLEGKLIQHLTIRENRIETGKVKAGVYLLRVTANNRTFQWKVVKR